jgi:NAD(P)H dehydrogenase (quinone)
MAKVLVTYYSQTGHTKAMAEAVGSGAESAGAEVTIKDVQHVKAQDLLGYDGIIIGSPTYYGLLVAAVKELMDDSVQFHGQLSGKVGGAFASSANIGGGNETTVLSILQALLVHGMVIQGSATGDHYGPVAINVPDERAKKQCQALGKRVAELAIRLFG